MKINNFEIAELAKMQLVECGYIPQEWYDNHDEPTLHEVHCVVNSILPDLAEEPEHEMKPWVLQRLIFDDVIPAMLKILEVADEDPRR